MDSSCDRRSKKVIDRLSAIAYVCKASLRLTGSTSANSLSAADLLFTPASSILCIAEAYSMNLYQPSKAKQSKAFRSEFLVSAPFFNFRTQAEHIALE